MTRSFSKSALTDPLNLQIEVLDALEQSLSSNGENVKITDPNNVTSFLIESMVTLGSDIVNFVEDKVHGLYALRAQTPEELYRHMSDYDYVNLISSPSSTFINLVIEKKYLVDNAESYGDDFSLVRIPKDTTFTIMGMKFGIHYPIDIRITKSNHYVLATYGVDTKNPLHSVKTNKVDLSTEKKSGLEFLVLNIPVYQFEKQLVEETVVEGTGYIKEYTCDDRFYAARFFTKVNGERVELGQTLSEDVYDVNRPTMKVKYLADQNKIRTELPQIYIDTGAVGNSIEMELYSTLGEIDVDITNITMDDMSLQFNPYGNIDKYGQILVGGVPTLFFVPTETRITGGSNGFDFEELRERVVNNSFYDSVPITPADLEKYFSAKGFRIQKYIDNITNRYYFAHRVLLDNLGNIVPAADMKIRFSAETVDQVSTMKKHLDGTITVLPTTLFRFKPENLISTPVVDSEKSHLDVLGKEQFVGEFNNTQYVYSPFHIHVDYQDNYPRAKSFDLASVEVESIVFKKENEYCVAQVNCERAELQHMEKGVGGYTLTLYSSRSRDIAEVAPENIRLYCMVRNTFGTKMGKEAEWTGKVGEYDTWSVHFETNYAFDKEGNIAIEGLSTPYSGGANINAYISLQSPVEVAFFAHEDVVEKSRTDRTMEMDIPDSILQSYIPLTRQDVNCRFGECVSDALNNIIDMQVSPERHAKYDHSKPLLYTEDQYERDEHGAPVYEIVDGEVVLNVVHQQGDPVYGNDGEPLYVYREGDQIIDSAGNPVIEASREYVYNVNALLIDAKYYISENPVHQSYVSGLSSSLAGYFATIREANLVMAENTRVYFRPVRTLGIGTFDQGDGWQVSLPLELDMRFRFHVRDYVLNDSELRNSIRQTTISIIDKEISDHDISLADVAGTVKEKLGEYIVHIDVLGVNGITEMQTIAMIDTDARPSVRQRLEIGKDGSIQLNKAIDIEFVLSA